MNVYTEKKKKEAKYCIVRSVTQGELLGLNTASTCKGEA